LETITKSGDHKAHARYGTLFNFLAKYDHMREMGREREREVIM
jgi:hypothetical protein